MNPRLKRLRRDHEKILELASRSRFIEIAATEGNPPEKYVLNLSCKGITKVDSRGGPTYSRSHRLGIHLGDDYPRKTPQFKMLTSVFHPNIAQNGSVCIGDEGDRGYAPSMGLDDLVVRIVEIIRYENVGLNSAYNTIAERWARRQHQGFFPLESSQIVSEELVEISILDEIHIVEKDTDSEDLDIVIY